MLGSVSAGKSVQCGARHIGSLLSSLAVTNMFLIAASHAGRATVSTPNFRTARYHTHCTGWLLAALLIVAVMAPGALVAASNNPGEPRCVILLHGLGRSSVSMKGVEWRLEEAGYAVVNLSYPWKNYSIEQLAILAVENGLDGCRQLGESTVGFVTHSLGGILLRQYLEEKSIAGLGRVVMLAPPNQGSTMADYLMANDLLEPLLPEPAQQLGTGENSVPRRLGPVQFELGVIAGSNTRALVSPGLENLPNDGTVAVDETRVEGMRDFIVLDVDHSFLMWREAVLDQVVLFLREGHFDHSPAAAGDAVSPAEPSAQPPSGRGAEGISD